MRHKDKMDNDNMTYSLVVEVNESDLMGIELEYGQRDEVMRKMKSGLLSEKLDALRMLTEKIEERNILMRN